MIIDSSPPQEGKENKKLLPDNRFRVTFRLKDDSTGTGTRGKSLSVDVKVESRVVVLGWGLPRTMERTRVEPGKRRSKSSNLQFGVTERDISPNKKEGTEICTGRNEKKRHKSPKRGFIVLRPGRKNPCTIMPSHLQRRELRYAGA